MVTFKKIKYQCIKILEPQDINYFSLAHLNLYLIDVNQLRNFSYSYDTLLEKSLFCFWYYDLEIQNRLFMESIVKPKKKPKKRLDTILIHFCGPDILEDNFRYKVLIFIKSILSFLMLITSIISYIIIYYLTILDVILFF